MNSAKESDKWHKGIYNGLKAGLARHDPRKVKADLYVTEMSYGEWFRAEGHYHDVPYVGMYAVSTAVELGVVAGAYQYLVA